MVFSNTEVFNFQGAIRGMRNPLASWHKSDSQFVIQCEHDESYEELYEVMNSHLEVALEKHECNDKDSFDALTNKLVIDYSEMLYNEGEQGLDEHHYEGCYIGANDLDLMKRLIKAGPEHRKFLRQIFVSVDITAPLYWWKEFDTYKIGTTANSTSTMHKVDDKPITLECFEIDDYNSNVDIFNNPSPMEYPLHDFIQCADGLIDMLESLRLKYKATKDKKYWKELIRWLPAGWLQTRTVTLNYENILSMLHQRANHKLNEWSGIDDPSKEYFCKWAWNLPYVKYLFADVIEKKDRWENE